MMVWTRFSLYILSCSILLCAGSALAYAESEKPSYLTEVPITIIDNRIQLTLPVGRHDLRFALDTGASRTVIFQSKTHSFEDMSATGDTMVAFPALDEIVQGTSLAPFTITIGNEQFSPANPILIKQRPPIGDRLSFKFNGILGQDFFEQYVVEIDPKEAIMRLYRPGSNLKPFYRTSIELYMKGTSPHLRFRTRLPWEKRNSLKELLLDSGYPGAMVIWNRRQFIDAAGTSKIDDYIDENKGIITLATFRIGWLRFENVPLFVAPKVPKQAQERDGLLGNNILVQFQHVIDFSSRRLLRPTVQASSRQHLLPTKQ